MPQFPLLAILLNALVCAPVEELELSNCEEEVVLEEVVLYDDAEEVLDSQEIVFLDEELEGEAEAYLEE